MALNAYLAYNAPDSTLAINARLKHLIQRGIFFGGEITATGPAVLTIDVAPFSAITDAGMVIESTTSLTRSVANLTINWIVARAYWDTTQPTGVVFTIESLTNAAYLSDPQLTLLIVLGQVDLTAGAPPILTSQISYANREDIDAVDRLNWKPAVANVAALPIPPLPGAYHHNQIGDLRHVIAANALYAWDGTTWNLFGAAVLYARADGYGSEPELDRRRTLEGSGITGGRVNNINGWSVDPGLTLAEHGPGNLWYLGFGPLRAIVNGHIVDTHATSIDLGLAAGAQYDVVYLEVWRETIADPSTHIFDSTASPPVGTVGTETFTNIIKDIESMGITNAYIAGSSYNINNFETVWDGTNASIVVTKWQILSNQVDTTVGPGTGQAMIADPYNNLPAATIPNHNATGFYGWVGTLTDTRVWIATTVADYDGVSWAIPLFIVRRDPAAEPATGILEFRTVAQGATYEGERWIFPVYPMADTSATLKHTAERVHEGFVNAQSADRPSGVTWNIDGSYLDTGIAGSEIDVVGAFKVNVRGFEIDVATGQSINLGVAPTPPTIYRRDLAYIQVDYVLYPDRAAEAPFARIGTYEWTGASNVAKDVYLQWRFVGADVGIALTPYTALLGLGYVVDPEDPGIWRQAVGADNRQTVGAYTYAIPLALVHRRNDALWTLNANPNGSGANQPRGWTDPEVLQPDEILDCRQRVCDSDKELNEIMTASMHKLLAGKLYTNMALHEDHPIANGIAGTRLLYSDSIVRVAGNVPGSHEIPRVNDNVTSIYSDGPEFWPVGTWFDTDGGAYSDALVTWATPSLTINAPAGAYLVTYNDGTNPAPAFTTESQGAMPFNKPIYYDHMASPATTCAAANITEGTWAETAWDADGRITQMQVNLVAPTGATTARLFVSYWVCYLRDENAYYANQNGGLFRVPDEIVSITNDNTGEVYAHDELIIAVPGTVVAGAGVVTITITSANVTTALGAAGAAYGAITMHDAWDVRVIGTSPLDVSTDLVSVSIDALQTTMLITLTSPGVTGLVGGESAIVDVVFSGANIDHWFRAYRPQKALTGPFYFRELTITSDGTTKYVIDATVAGFRYQLGNSEVQAVYVSDAGLGWIRHEDWERIDPDNTWTGVYGIEFMSGTPAGALTIKLVTKQTDPLKGPAGTEDILIHYINSPYQGIASSVADATKWLAGPSRVLAPGDTVISTAGSGVTVYYGVNVTNTATSGEPYSWTSSIATQQTAIWGLMNYKPNARGHAAVEQISTVTPWLPAPQVALSNTPQEYQMNWEAVQPASMSTTSVYNSPHVRFMPWVFPTSIMIGLYASDRPPIAGQLIDYPDSWTAPEIAAAIGESMQAGVQGFTITTGISGAAPMQAFGVGFLAFGNRLLLQAVEMGGMSILGSWEDIDFPLYLTAAPSDPLLVSGSTNFLTAMPILLRPEDGDYQNIPILQICSFQQSSWFGEAVLGGTFDAFVPLWRPVIGKK